LLLFWALIGPGLLAAMADNDAGGMISYCVTGVKFGIGLFIPLVFCLAVVTYTVQEMAMRLGTVTQIGFTKLIGDHYGRSWLYYHLATLFSENLLTLLTEFIGMTAGLVILGLPLWISDLISLLLILSITVLTGYWTKERLALLIGALNVIFVVVAVHDPPQPGCHRARLGCRERAGRQQRHLLVRHCAGRQCHRSLDDFLPGQRLHR
jgi:Mn2+/Fe2+ NRAMP family transporter